MPEISRRDLLRKGALLGGSVLWVTPVVQTIGMGRAFGQTELVSPGGERCMSVDLLPTGPTLDDGTVENDNKYIFAMRVCNCGAIRIDDIFIKLEVVSLSVEGGTPTNPGITWVTANIGSLEPADGPVQDCFHNTTEQNIKNSFGVSSGDSVEFTVRLTATDSFGPVSDDETYQAVIV